MRTTKFLGLVFMMVLLSACGRQAAERSAERAIEQETGGKARVDVKDDGTVRVDTDEGSFVAGGNQLPEDWPEDAPVYPEATISYSASVNPQTGKPGMAVVLVTTDTITTVSDYYNNELVAQDWTIGSTMNAVGTSVISATKDNRTLSLMISGAEGKTMITMGIETGTQE